MSFYLRKEWIDVEDGIERVLIHYTFAHRGEGPDWERNRETREMYPEWGWNRKRRAKVVLMGRDLDGEEIYNFHYKFEVIGARARVTEPYVEEIVSDGSLTFIDYAGHYTNICLYWSVNGWGAYNYSTMFEDGTGLDHPLSSLRFYGHAHDPEFLRGRYEMLRNMPLPHVYRGKIHAPRGSRVDFCFHIMRRGDPEGRDYDFWDNNEGLNYRREIR
ncbi:MAG TPA: hypothetical protein VF553_18485 [Pyrinomonadaceae bacterium]|jgi:hypothetical protein